FLSAGCSPPRTHSLSLHDALPISLDAYVLAEVIHDAGLPAGVFNMVTGTGPQVGEAISRSAHIDMVSFTGSTRAGKAVAAAASEDRKSTRLNSSHVKISYAVFCLK